MTKPNQSLVEFEANMQALTDIVENMERGQLPLSEALSQFQEGLKRMKACHQALDHAEKVIAQWSKDGDWHEVGDDATKSM